NESQNLPLFAQNSEDDLPECSPWAVCSKVDLYETPWVERQCRCSGRQSCPSQLPATDGHTITDKTRQFKLCEPVKKLPKCRYFRDITWTLASGADNVTEQIVHCHCPRGAVAYLIKRQAVQAPHGLLGYRYSFACSPQSFLFPSTETTVPKERTMSPVHSKETPAASRRGEHQYSVPVSSRSHLPTASQRCRGHRRQELYGRGDKDVQRLLHLLKRHRAVNTGEIQLDAQVGSGALQPSVTATLP
ncbi:hypothetical protein Cfor_03307, partial [Coptotermes formosanus]